MGSLSDIPWKLLLPGDRSRTVRVLGDPRAVADVLDGLRLEGAEATGPAGAVLRLPGGPAPERQTLDSLIETVGPGGVVLWISERHEAGVFDETDPRSAGTALRFFAGGRALWSPEASWTVPLRSAGKTEFVRSLLLRPLSRLLPTRVRRYRYRVEMLGPGEHLDACWILELIRDLAEKQIAAVDASSLGRIDRTATGLAVCQLSTGGAGRLALKVAADEVSAEGLSREAAHLETLRALSGLPERIVDSLPRVLASGRFLGSAWRLETWLDGRSGADAMYRLRRREQITNVALDWIGSLHESSLGPPRRPRELAAWARATVARTSAQVGSRDEQFAQRVADYLESRLDRFSPPTVMGHGDYWLGNILRHPGTEKITGVIDWQHGDDQAPPLEDVLHLLFTRKSLFTFYDHGSRVAAFLTRRGRSGDRRRVRKYLNRLGLDPAAAGLLVLLYWVRYLAAWETTEGPKPGWYRRSYSNVREVLGNDFETRLDRLGSRLDEA